ncbi:tetratricopeptide repeat protein [Polaribacter cellanae]|uniref:Tetratricopeptide repeat protein n=1 Tax=Polaribacter cellanae TaxID=2818493 RepID=A0A975CT17_9FLAO|nr:tetratricopeptide repeat protein [Polaribacter cellanae]QTE24335.1 tetratricopeptide repeat protein [Polaribacter cellanae]
MKAFFTKYNLFKTHFPILIVVIFTTFIYWPATNGNYIVGWDDDQQILNNADVLNFSWESIKNYFSTYYVASYQPLASLTFGLEYYFFGANAKVHHITNLIFHLLNIILVYNIINRLFLKKKVIVWLVTLVFAFHPLQTELLGWVSTRSTLLGMFFYLSAVLSYILYIKSHRKRKYIIICSLFFVLSLFTKSSAVTLPLVLLLLDYYYKDRLNLKMVLYKIPFFIGSIAIGLVSLDSRRVLDSLDDFKSYYTFLEKISISSYTILKYVWKGILPNDLVTFYPYPLKIKDAESLDLIYLISPILLILLVILTIYIYLKSSDIFKKQWLLGCGIFIIHIGLYLNFTPFGPTMWAERYMYIPLIGLFICIGLLLTEFLSNKYFKNIIYLGLFLSLGVYAYKSRTQSYIWKDRISLWKNAIKNPNNTYPLQELGNEYQQRKEYVKAISYYNNAIKINPYLPEVYYYRGLAIKEKGDLNYAKIDFERVIKANGSKKAKAFFQRGLLFEKLNLLDSALVDYDSAIAINPKSEALLRKQLLSQINDPYSADIHKLTTKADSLFSKGNFAEALKKYDAILTLAPNLEKAMLHKGMILINLSKFTDANTVLTEVLKNNPSLEKARLSRAYSFTQLNLTAQAIKDYNYVTDVLNNKNGEVLYYKALAYLKANNREKACENLKLSKKKGYAVSKELLEKTCQ